MNREDIEWKDGLLTRIADRPKIFILILIIIIATITGTIYIIDTMEISKEEYITYYNVEIYTNSTKNYTLLLPIPLVVTPSASEIYPIDVRIVNGSASFGWTYINGLKQNYTFPELKYALEIHSSTDVHIRETSPVTREDVRLSLIEWRNNIPFARIYYNTLVDEGVKVSIFFRHYIKKIVGTVDVWKKTCVEGSSEWSLEEYYPKIGWNNVTIHYKYTNNIPNTCPYIPSI